MRYLLALVLLGSCIVAPIAAPIPFSVHFQDQSPFEQLDHPVYMIESVYSSASAWVVQCEPFEEGFRVVAVKAAHFVLPIEDDFLFMVYADEHEMMGTRFSVHPTEDLALVEFFSHTYVRPRAIAPRRPVYGEELWLEGYPGGEGPYLRSGYYSGADRVGMCAWWGDSGGPISDSRGNVVGILVAGIQTVYGPIPCASIMVAMADVEPWLRKELQHERFEEAPGGEGEAVPVGGSDLGESESGR